MRDLPPDFGDPFRPLLHFSRGAHSNRQVRPLLMEGCPRGNPSMVERDSRSRKVRTGPGSIITCCLAAFVAAMSGCSNEAEPPVSNTIHLELDFGSGVTLTSLAFILTGPNSFRRIGTIPVGDQPS